MLPQKLLFPSLISIVRSVNRKEKFEESLKKVVEMGLDPTTVLCALFKSMSIKGLIYTSCLLPWISLLINIYMRFVC